MGALVLSIRRQGDGQHGEGLGDPERRGGWMREEGEYRHTCSGRERDRRIVLRGTAAMLRAPFSIYRAQVPSQHQARSAFSVRLGMRMVTTVEQPSEVSIATAAKLIAASE